jgi:hypothetical protein
MYLKKLKKGLVKHTVQIIFKFYYYSLNEDTYLKKPREKRSVLFLN